MTAEPTTQERFTVEIMVDPARCTGHGRCYSLAPAVFDADDDGFCLPRGVTFVVAADREETARLGARSCPEGAITVVTAE
ncbi:ferredoxin [Frankia sp. Cppng1_Ct_nod]|uniref:ferredoxin n=1 Tax=Frankia sp. Cppng1_Ct_nod TaxID=2897162 RepID=UPI00104105C2|nr:ferredoxin [Frankia sp. Cppng1_Ct_nod]